MFDKQIHLLYVPTIFCNLSCRYCYLGELTDAKTLKLDNQRANKQLQAALDKFVAAGVLPFNVSLHGGEIGCLNSETLESLFQTISKHYAKYEAELQKMGFDKREPHVKTNLYNFEQHEQLFRKHKVSVSASIDLPLSMHDMFRRNKAGQSTLQRSLRNLKLLAKYPHRKKFSSTLYQAHFERIDELIADIWHIHRDVGFDMNRYNFMFGFEAEYCNSKYKNEKLPELKPMSQAQQVSFYHRMKAEFANSELSEGFANHWFEEFTPNFCTNSVNCGDKFFLLQSDGEVFSCVRGQSNSAFRYGNIFADTVDALLQNANLSIKTVINTAGLDEDCIKCEYIQLCKTGCPFVKHQMGDTGKSYTCELQKVIYRDYPKLYPPLANEAAQKAELFDYAHHNHPQRLFGLFGNEASSGLVLPSDFGDIKNELAELIHGDSKLQQLYSPSNFAVSIDGQTFALHSQILKNKRTVHFVNTNTSLVLKIRRLVFNVACNEIVNNTLHLQMLRNTPVVYGDERRTKQAHVFTYQLFYDMLVEQSPTDSDFVELDIMPLLRVHKVSFVQGVVNNLFTASSALRNYHYSKQKNNAFYHIQAINLPFPNFEFIWIEG